MQILIRGSITEECKIAQSVKTGAESELQKMFIESPSLINIDEIREGTSSLVFALSEFGLKGSGNTDIIAFSPNSARAVVVRPVYIILLVVCVD
jgi:hypothetical protein